MSATTKKAAIIGASIGHSKSPAMMNAAFQKLGMDYEFSIINAAPDQFKEVLMGLPAQNFVGLTVTIPYKLEIMQYMDEIDPLAKLIGAVNTVKFENGKMIGYNTDGEGFVRGIEQDFGINVPESTFFVVGAGGVSRAITTTLASRHPKHMYIESLYYKDSKNLCKHINENVYDCCEPIPYGDEYEPYMAKSTVVINASFIGSPPHENEYPLDPALLRADQLVADVNYNPLQTKFLQAAEAKGCRFLNGQYQLFHQGKIAFKLWTGVDAPGDVMRKAVFEG